MKNKLWLLQIPLIAIFTFAFVVTRNAEQGTLRNPLLRSKIYPVLRTISGSFTNLKFRLRGPRKVTEKVVIVEIDNSSLEDHGRWPWHRDLTAQLVDSVFKKGAKVVGLDMVFSEPDQRVPDELKTILVQQKLGGLADAFETDNLLAQVFKHYSDRLVTGWAAEGMCQPAYEGVDTCPVLDPEAIAQMPPNFERFGFDEVKFPSGGFQIDRTPLMSAFIVLPNLPSFDEASRHSGFFQAFPDYDGYIRRTSLLMMVNGKPIPSLALAMARLALDERLGVEFGPDQMVKDLRFLKSNRPIAVTPVGSMEINFHGPGFTHRYVSATDVLQDAKEIRIGLDRNIASTLEAELKDAYVLIGLTALGVHDMRAFPFDSNTPGVEGHATILENLLRADYLISGATGGKYLWVIVLMTLGALGFAYAAAKLESVPALVMFLLTVGGLGFLDQVVLFGSRNINLNVSFLYLEIFTIFAFTLAAKYVMEEGNKKFIKGAFSKYVAPSIVDSILKDPTKLVVGGEKKDLTIMFSDIRGFTTFSERMEPKMLSQFLNEYLGAMTEVIFECDGTLDKYIGDAVMAFWGAPGEQDKHAANACRAAVRMIQKLEQLKPEYLQKYGVEVNIGVGLNSGAVSVGNMGSERIFAYTVIGDHVNLSSRLEGLTKHYGVKIVTTRFTFDDIARVGEPLPPHRTLDLVKVKGKKNAVELIHILEKDFSPEGLKLFEQGRQLYTSRRWDEAITSFNKANELLRQGPDAPDETSLMYIERCEAFKQTPPDTDWDGSWEMTSK